MIILRRNIRGVRIRNLIFEESPHPQSLAAALLMKQEYFFLDADTREKPWCKQLTFNLSFLTEQLKLKGKLTCEYCGKENLLIENPIKGFLATADHIMPKALGGAAFNFNNLAVACYECNSKKGAKMGRRISKDKCIIDEG